MSDGAEEDVNSLIFSFTDKLTFSSGLERSMLDQIRYLCKELPKIWELSIETSHNPVTVLHDIIGITKTEQLTSLKIYIGGGDVTIYFTKANIKINDISIVGQFEISVTGDFGKSAYLDGKNLFINKK